MRESAHPLFAHLAVTLEALATAALGLVKLCNGSESPGWLVRVRGSDSSKRRRNPAPVLLMGRTFNQLEACALLAEACGLAVDLDHVRLVACLRDG